MCERPLDEFPYYFRLCNQLFTVRPELLGSNVISLRIVTNANDLMPFEVAIWPPEAIAPLAFRPQSSVTASGYHLRPLFHFVKKVPEICGLLVV